jgi:hypothetical protein
LFMMMVYFLFYVSFLHFIYFCPYIVHLYLRFHVDYSISFLDM